MQAVVLTYTHLRASLDCSEEVHRSSILKEWSNMIGYEMGSSAAGIYIMAKTSSVENFKN